jgi:UDP-N-acetylmuramoyl-L-alanyl-D-glutamate--2,6-diaminopimelate ligase
VPVCSLKEIISSIETEEIHGPRDLVIDGLSYDAFKVRPGDLFLAVEGVNFDRHQFIQSVLDKGIRAIVHSKPLSGYRKDVAYIRVENVQRAMSPISAEFFGHPSRELFIIGVTGTNGKSTTCSLIYQLLIMFQKKTGIISSVYHDFGEGLEENVVHQSTPEAPVLHQGLYEAVQRGVEFMVLEATSHGLSERNNRVGDVDFDAAVFTNVTHEHLEFHGSMKQYIADKANLFGLLSRNRSGDGIGIVNLDDPNASAFIDACSKPIYSFGIESDADYRARQIEKTPVSSAFSILYAGGSIATELSLPGSFNVSNALAAAVVVSKTLKIPITEVAGKLKYLTAVRGRMHRIERGQSFAVIVDFAHTPDSFRKILPDIKSQIKGKLIVVFGSAGERDTEKRPIQGKIADAFADIIVLTDEDPRGEKPMKILEEIASACKKHTRNQDLYLLPDRKSAIQTAIGLAQEGDAVLLLGKGHETSIAYAQGDIKWDEIRITEECLENAGYQ